MFNRFEHMHHRSRLLEPRPEITDPYTQVLELELRPTYQGPHSFLGYKHPQPARSEWKVVPITTPNHFLQGLENLILITEMNHIEVLHPRFATKSPSTYLDSAAYKRDLEEMYKKYSGIYKGILEKCTGEQKKQIDELLEKARNYRGGMV